ncbi:methylaspartate mutase subunit E [Streptomyces glomeratus]|uniref:B12-binding domain-containing protein n=1 Tax=Streptomyces glomeratus TaxID=284452 RepID=A0ABP6LVI7_9ACTN|nr:methylaspartate mutase subunit E [Streptomyces glomeratus]MCF1510912.1 methylaspartate mutase subunit E [Streptomyces glomeratus]
MNADTGDANGKVVTLGGVGGDSHSVGLIILSRVLRRAGYTVRYAGIQCSVTELCEAARGADAVLVSNMDGHARHYLADLRDLRAELCGDGARWYLGGRPAVSVTDSTVAELTALGFHRVFLGHVEPAKTLALLAADLADTTPGPAGGRAYRAAPSRRITVRDAVERSFVEERDEVLHQWRTGHEARDLVENAEVLLRRANFAEAQHKADRKGELLIQPRTGVDDQDDQRALFHALRAAGADVLSFQIDSLTRNNAYAQIEMLRKGAAADGPQPHLNGYPAVNHGARAMRRITAEFSDVPFQVRHSTRDPRLLAELAFAAGISAFEGGPITYNLPYFRDYHPVEAMASWRYVDRLAALYWRRFGIVIDREFFGVLTACLVPPCLAVAVNVLEALLAAGAGVRSVSLGYAEQGNRAQDIAAIRVLGRLGREYLDRFSYGDVAVYTVFHQYMGAFPTDTGKAITVLLGSAETARLSGAHRMMLKSYVEATRIPSAHDNSDSLRLARKAIGDAGGAAADTAAVDAEEELLTRETRALLEAALRLGEGDPRRSVAAAIEAGVIDVPFSPSRWNAARTVSIRDLTGAVRLADTGGLPFPPDLVAFHRDRVRHRLRDERRPLEQVVEADILDIARGRFASWPLRMPAGRQFPSSERGESRP